MFCVHFVALTKSDHENVWLGANTGTLTYINRTVSTWLWRN